MPPLAWFWARANAGASRPKALLRYFAISAAIVLAAFAIVGVYWNREQLAIRIKSVFVPVPPKAAQSEPPSKGGSPAFVANAGWALSVLPECFTQTSKATGPLKYVLSTLPHRSAMLRAGTSLRIADCRVTVTNDTVIVTRGSDKIRVPPIARLYQAPGTIALLRGADDGFELRVYETK